MKNITDYNCENTKRLNLVLDVDETLVRSFDDLTEYKIFKEENFNEFSELEDDRLIKLECFDIVNKKGECYKDNFCFLKRPHLDDFLDWSLSNFRKVIIWSAGKHNYVHAIVNNIFQDVQPDHVLTHDDLYLHSKGFSKPLEILKKWDKNINLDNTLIIDDLETNFAEVNPDNAIHIPEYSPKLNINDIYGDDSLHKIMFWFKKYDSNIPKDIRKMNKENIFD